MACFFLLLTFALFCVLSSSNFPLVFVYLPSNSKTLISKILSLIDYALAQCVSLPVRHVANLRQSALLSQCSRSTQPYYPERNTPALSTLKTLSSFIQAAFQVQWHNRTFVMKPIVFSQRGHQAHSIHS